MAAAVAAAADKTLVATMAMVATVLVATVLVAIQW